MDMSSPLISFFPDRPGLNSLPKESTEGKQILAMLSYQVGNED